MNRLIVTTLLALHLGTAVALRAQSPQTPSPEMAKVLDTLSGLHGKPIETLTPKEARKQPTPADAVAKLMKEEKIKTEKVKDVDNRSIDGPKEKIKIRIYTPEGNGPFPVILYFHGGGFVIADLDTYDATPRALANAVGAVVVSAHYRQAPENKFPAAHEDAFAAYQWTVNNAAKIKGDPNRIAVAGESAGGNLANSVSLMARDAKMKLPVYQLLVYPVTGSDMNTPSYQDSANAKPLNKEMMKWFFSHAATPADASDPRLAPINASLQGLPATTIVTAQIDPLRSDGEMYARKLEAAGVKVTYRNYPGATHEFFGMGAVVPAAKEALNAAAEDLRKAVGPTSALAQP